MRLCVTRAGAQRTWTVELRPQAGGPVLVCQQCTHHGRPLNDSAARAELLAHLALHARRNLVPVHLRTCQCRERGCGWHPRHRGCQGPIRLVLARERGGRIWRLTDACASCAAATAQASVVPETVLAAGPPRPGQAADFRTPSHLQEQESRTRVREMLSYLAAALPAETGAAARLIALQCALRMKHSTQVQLPVGVLRSLRLESASDALQELDQARWLRTGHASPGQRGCVVAQLLDVCLTEQRPTRSGRLRAADWALRVSCRIRTDSAPLSRLAALCLTAHTAPGDHAGMADVDQLARECGVPRSAFTVMLDQLNAARFLSSWSVAPASGDLGWALTDHHGEAR
jgi:hypothetical protein